MYILQQLADSGWSGKAKVQAYDASTSACVLTMVGSPDAAGQLSLDVVTYAMASTTQVLEGATGEPRGCLIPVEIGTINSLAALVSDVASLAGLLRPIGYPGALPSA